MSEQKNTTQIEKKKPYHSWRHYFRMGLTAFLTVAACITFFFVLYRWNTISAIIGKILKAAEPIVIGLALAYLLMPVKQRIEDDDQQDETGLKQLTPVFLNANDHKGYDRRSDEDQDHNVLELVKKALR